jgi:hypothetical protein
MTDILIRNVDGDKLAAMKALAAASGLSLQKWAETVLYAATAQPVVKRAYRLRGYAGDSLINIVRLSDGGAPGGGTTGGLTQAQLAAYKRAQDLVQRNAPGDREQAIGVLQAAGFEVFEQ